MRRLKLPHCCLCSPAYCSVKEIFHALLHFIQGTRQNRAFQMLFAASGKIQSYFFPINVVSIFSSFNSVLFLSPTTKTIPITSAIIDDTITWIIGCIGFYKFLPYYVRFKRRRWYRKILQRENYAIRVLILASHLELYNSEGKPVIFIYKAQIKKGKRNLPKKHQMIGEIIEAKKRHVFCGFGHRTY